MSSLGPPGTPTPTPTPTSTSTSTPTHMPTRAPPSAAGSASASTGSSSTAAPSSISTPTPLSAARPSIPRPAATGSPRFRSGSSLRPQSVTGFSSSASPPGPSRSSSAFSFAPWDFPPSPAPPRALRHSRHSSLSAARAVSAPPPPEESPPSAGQRSKFEETKAVSFTWIINDVALLRDEVEHSSAPGAVVDDPSPPPSSSSSASSSSLDSDQEESDGLTPISSQHDADGITRSVSAGAGRSEVWTTEPIFGDGQWKLELVRRQTVVHVPNPNQGQEMHSSIPVPVPVSGLTHASAFRTKRARRIPRKRQTVTTLSVYLTNCAMEKPLPALKRKPQTPLFRHAGPVHASIMVGVRPLSALPQDGGTGVLDPTPYLHQSFHSFTFSHEAEYFACHELPPLSKLMEHPDVRRQDAVALTINIVTGAGAAVMRTGPTNTATPGPGTIIFPQPHTRYLAPSILDALGSLLDCPRSGDVCIRTRERGVVYMPLGWSARQSARLLAAVRQRGKSPTERTYASDEPEAETEADGEQGWWAQVRPPKVEESLVLPFPLGSEMPPAPRGEMEPVLVVRDRVIWAHSAILKARSGYFATMLDSAFAEGGGDGDGDGDGDSRGVHELRMADADYATVYWLLRYLYVEHVEFAAATGEAKEACGNVDDCPALGPPLGPPLTPQGRDGFLVDWAPVEALDWLSKYTDAVLYDWEESLPPTPRQSESELDAPPTDKNAWGPIDAVAEAGMEEREWTRPARIGEGRQADPHMHPCASPSSVPPASALTIYRLAHRYGEARLLAAAEQHVLQHLVPSTAFRVFLATRFFTSLHAGVKRFVYRNWSAVAESQEFERCCDEVSVGDWGADAGRSLHSFMKSLLSPALHA